MDARHKIVVAGAGGMGSAVGLMLRELADFEVDLWIGDIDLPRAKATAAWISDGSSRPGTVEPFLMPATGSSPELEKIFDGGDALLDCLPGAEAPRMARFARERNLHYANLTEYVHETDQVVEIARGADTGFVVQTGIAPGYVNILGHGLFLDFCRDHGVTAVDSIEMRVGALTPHAPSPHCYGFTWSSIGVATEYVKPAIAVRDFATTELPSLSERRNLLLGGILYEEALTSGGAADLPRALAGKVRNLDYKTLRYPGHYAWVEAQLAECPAGEDAAQFLHHRMLEQVPHTDGDDLVLVYAAVQGKNAAGELHRREIAYRVGPMQIGARRLKAIQTTTTSALAESIRMVLQPDGPRGVCFQSQIDRATFEAGPFIKAVYRDSEI